MLPSFFSLYKRGRYCLRPAPGGVTEEGGVGDSEREERERFVVAALAFSIKHDFDSFGIHFFHSICCDCDPAGDEAEKPNLKEFDIRIEDNDLDLVLLNPEKTYVYVVEAKITAHLKIKQNPEKKEFFEPEGYGHKIEAEFKDVKKIRYIILGARELIPCNSLPQRPRWSFSQKSWSDLAKGFPQTEFASDLRDFLGRIRITAFMLKQTEALILNPDLKTAALAHLILENTRRALEIPARCARLEVAVENEPDHWYFGIQVESSDLGGRTVKSLVSVVKPANAVCWFGYEDLLHSSQNSTVSATVWFYTTPSEAQALQQKLSRFGAEIEHGYVVTKKISVKQNESIPDGVWFLTVLEAAAVL